MKDKLVIGLMSGTSADGIDVALCRITPDLSVEFIDGLVFPYPTAIRNMIFNAFSQNINIEELCKLNFLIGDVFASATNELISVSGYKSDQIDLIGSHGQTIFHYPYNTLLDNYSEKSTLQVGESSIIAEKTNITVISDFRTADIAAGGQGAPLVCFADEIFFKNNSVNRAIQNIGGIGNVTILSRHCDTFGFDTGPGNVLLDMYIQKYFDQKYDAGGVISSHGQVDEEWLKQLLDNSYYLIKPPKTTGRELFNDKYFDEIDKYSPDNPYNAVATLTALTSKTIYDAYYNFVFPKTYIDEIILGGGGAYNLEIIKYLKKYFGEKMKILTHDDFNISNKYKEAMAFALLAYTTYFRIPNNVPSCTGAKYKCILGKITPAQNRIY
ncbi:MAG: anhydro-N-acetylmuramic acid kinase [bacterium]